MRLYLSILLMIFALLVGCDGENVTPIAYLPTQGKVESVVSKCEPKCPIRHTVDIYPNEIYLGDTVYVITTDENISKDNVKSYIDFSSEPIYQTWLGQAEISNLKNNEKYIWLPEFPNGVFAKYILPQRDLQSGDKRLQTKCCFEFPPLEDKELPFWKEMENSIPSKGIKCNFRFLCGFEHQGVIKQVETTVEILIKPRPKFENALLEKWYSNTPEKLFPRVCMGRKIPHDMDLKSSGKSDIRIGWKSYDPWLFVRVGNRKPSDPNNPTTLNGWRKLESSLMPSTMRDEVRLVRLQLEFYSAKLGKESDDAKNELVTWLQGLPTPQRTVMVSFLRSKKNDFMYMALKRKHRELISSLNEMP